MLDLKTPARHRALLGKDRGALEFSLIVSIVILSIIILAVGATLLFFTRSTANASMETQAADAAAAVFEKANATPWDDLAHLDTDPDLSDPIIDALGEGQNLVTLTSDKFESFDPTPAKIEGGTENFGTINDNFTVYTSITWENEPAISAVTGDYTAMFGTKRIAVEVVWGEGELQSQTFETLRSPGVNEAVPSNVNVVAGGGLDVQREIDAPVLTGNDETGDLSATITQAYKWEIQTSSTTSFSSSKILCSGEYRDIRDSVEDCLYEWDPAIGFTPSFRVKVWTLDTDDADSTLDGVKYSNVVTFDGPYIEALTGGKVAWNKDQIFWTPTTGLMNAENDSRATIRTVVTRTLTGRPTQTADLDYNIAGDTRTYTTAEGDNASYRVCTFVNGTSVACSNVLGPMYTIETPDGPTLNGVRPSGKFFANYTWTANADSYEGEGGSGVTFDIQQKDASGTWHNVALDSETTSLNNVRPYEKSNGYKETTVSLRVRVKNDAGFSSWTTKTVTIGELPTKPTLSVSGFSDPDNDGNTSVTFTWTKGSYAYGGWYYEFPRQNVSTNVGVNGARTRTTEGARGDVKEFRVRGKNEFGVSAWATTTITHEGKPTAKPTLNFSPRVGYIYGNWSGVAGATAYETQWAVNTTASDQRRFHTWNDSSKRNANWTGGINEGDKVTAVIRGCNNWGCGPWSNWTGWVFTDMRSVGKPGGAGGVPHLSGGRYTWNALSCDSGSQAQYRVHNGSWGSWGTGRAFTESFSYGSTGSVHIQQRCINTTTSKASTGNYTTQTVGWRLLPYPSGGYNNYPESTWNTNNFRRLEQVLKGYQNASASNSCYSNYSDASNIAINGSTFGLQSPYPRASGSNSSWRSHWGETVVFQCWLNYRDGGASSNLNMSVGQRGWWGPLTTNKLRKVLLEQCGHKISISVGDWSTNEFDSYEMHRFTYCLNEGAV